MRFVVLLVLVCAGLWPGGVRAGEYEERAATVTEVRKAFFQDDYAKLDQLALEYRTRKSRTASGTWKLSLLYTGLEPQNPDEAQAIENLTLAWSKNSPSSPTAKIAYAHALLWHGWQYRRDGADVTSEAADAFIHYNKLAEAHLLKVKDAASMDPQWYTEMLAIATNLGWHKRRVLSLVSEAAVREPGYYQTYFQALSHFLPKWNGDAAQVESFIDVVAARTAGTEGRSMYARLYWMVQSSDPGQNVFHTYGANWAMMEKAFTDLIARYPAPFNVSAYAQFACLAGEAKRHDELTATIGPEETPAMYAADSTSACAL